MTPEEELAAACLAALSRQEEFDQVRATALADVPLQKAQVRLVDVVWKPRGRRAWTLKPSAYSGAQFVEHLLDRWDALSRTPPRSGRRRNPGKDAQPRSLSAASVVDHLIVARPGADAAAIAREVADRDGFGSYAAVKRRLQRLEKSGRVSERFADELFAALGRPDLLRTIEPWRSNSDEHVSAREQRAYAPGFPYETLTGGRGAWIPELIGKGWLVVDDTGILRRGPRFDDVADYDEYVREWRERTGRPPVDDDLAT